MTPKPGLKFAFCLLAMITSTTAWASGIATVPDPSCRKNRADSFDEGWRFTRSSHKFADQCLDVTTRRAVRVLSDGKQTLEFANFYHQRRFWVASWDKHDFPSLKFSIVYFESGVPGVQAAHTELRFHFKQGLLLTAQTDSKRTRVKDVVVDWEATFPPGFSFDFMDGFTHNQAFVGRVLSLSARTPENIISPGVIRKIRAYDINLKPAIVARLFWQSIYQSHFKGSTEFYNIISNNCTTELFLVGDYVLRQTDPARMNGVKPFHVGTFLDPIAGPSRKALIKRRLISPQDVPKSYAQEIGLKEQP